MAEKEPNAQEGNYLAMAFKVFIVICVLNVIAALVFYFFISPHVAQH